MPKQKQERILWAKSIYGALNDRGLVVLELDGKELLTLQPDNARELAHNIMQAAEAAEGDEFLIKFARETLRADGRTVMELMRQFRTFRKLRRGQEAEDHHE